MSEMNRDTAAILEGLKALGARFDDLNARFDGLSSRFDGLGMRVDAGFAAVDARFAKLEARVDAGFAHLNRLDGEIADVRAVNRRIIGTVVRLEGKMDDLTDRVATKDDISTVLGHVDGLAGRIDEMNFCWSNHEERISALEKRRPT